MVVEQYAKSILTVMIAVIVFGFFSSGRLFHDVHVNLWSSNSLIKRGIAFDQIKNITFPIRFCDEAYRLQEGERIEVLELLAIENKDARAYTIHSIAIYDEALKEQLSTANDIICIEKVGVYWVLAEVSYENGAKTSVMAKIFVTERG